MIFSACVLTKPACALDGKLRPAPSPATLNGWSFRLPSLPDVPESPDRRSLDPPGPRPGSRDPSCSWSAISPVPLSPVRNGDAPPAVYPRFRALREVRRLYLLDLKTTLRDQRRNVPCQVTAREHPVEYRFPPVLPASHSRIGGTPMLEKDEPAVMRTRSAATNAQPPSLCRSSAIASTIP